MVDLTGANLVAYLLRHIKDVVARNPRFRNTLGDVTFQNNQQVQWGNVQAIIKNVTASGTRLSPDYFMCTQHGRVTVAKLGDKEGTFIEWPLEIDKTRKTPTSGVYNIQVDYTDEKDQLVQLTMQQFKWTMGTLQNAQGSVVYFNSALDNNGGLNAPRIPQLDLTTLVASEAETGKPVTVRAFNSSTGGFMYVLTPCQTLVLTRPDNTILNQDGSEYWYQRTTDVVICFSTLGGSELINIPVPYVSFTISDQDGYQLRGQDFTMQSRDWISLASFSPKGSKLTAHVVQKLAPVSNSATNPENVINIGFVTGQDSAVTDQVNLHSTAGDFNNVPINADGTVTLPTLLTPGQWLRYDVRLATPSITMQGKKYTMNGFVKTIVDPKAPNDPSKRTVYLDPVTQQPSDPLPGLWLAMGDAVVAGDQCALIINPEVTETYEIYGSKDNITFTIETKANDLQTASDLAEAIKSQFLIFRRENMERDGLTILESPRDMSAQQRDISGLNVEYTYSQAFVGMADWKCFVPKVTRMASFELTTTGYTGDFPGKIQLPIRLQAVGASLFVSSYA